MCCIFNMFHKGQSSGDGDVSDGPWERERRRRNRASDEDNGRYFGEPDIDSKASSFIARFHESRVMDAESQTYSY